MGSLLTALASWLAARAAGGCWLLRIDDLDRPRCPPGAADEILRQLEAHGLSWDEVPRYQSRHIPEYEAALADLVQRGLTYRCRCTRAQLAKDSSRGPDGAVYAGTCRNTSVAGTSAMRVMLGEGRIELLEAWGARHARDIAREIGDIVVKRADGQIAYQLACVVDEGAQRITEVVRGADLLGSSFQQQALRRILGAPSPGHVHLPLVVDARGHKLSKQNHAAPVESARAGQNLRTCLGFLGLAPPAEIAGAAPAELLGWAIERWRVAGPPRSAQTGVCITYNAVQQT